MKPILLIFGAAAAAAALVLSLAGARGTSKAWAATEKVVGGACTIEDAYRRPLPEAPAPEEQLATQNEMPAFRGPFGPERHELPPGVGFCLLRSELYPRGYYTMNCTSNADCPGTAACDGSLCRAPCRRNSDCESPAICGRPSGALGVRFCVGVPGRDPD